MPRFTLKMDVFPSIALETHKCVSRPSEQCLFFQDNRFEGSYALVYSKMNVFPSISIETPKMCVQTLRTVLISPGQSI